MSATEIIRSRVDDFNRLFWILSGETMNGSPRHECPTLSIYGHCGTSEQCSKCTRVK